MSKELINLKSPQRIEPKLNNRQLAFVAYYLANGFNATRAALQAGYAKKSAHSQACDLLKKPNVKNLIEYKLEHERITASEVLQRYKQIIDFNYGDYLKITDNGDVVILLQKFLDNGHGHMIEQVQHNRWGKLEIILKSQTRALDQLAKILKLTDNGIGINVNVETIKVVSEKDYNLVIDQG